MIHAADGPCGPVLATLRLSPVPLASSVGTPLAVGRAAHAVATWSPVTARTRRFAGLGPPPLCSDRIH
eukprot:11161658-Lingulodinium_polyedra.AAC.1